MSKIVANASDLEQELDWFRRILDLRFRLHAAERGAGASSVSGAAVTGSESVAGAQTAPPAAAAK